MGPPGSGKGTFSFFMTQEKNYHQICLGDIIRIHKKNNSAIAKELETKGGSVDDDLACRIIGEEVTSCIKNKLPFIIDGFPRTVPALKFLVQLLKEKNLSSHITFVHFIVDDQTCIDRIDKRLVCFGCSQVFNMTTKKPRQEMICDSCNSLLEVRDGDAKAVTIKRLASYRNQTEPLLEMVRADFKVITIDSKASIEELLNFYKTL